MKLKFTLFLLASFSYLTGSFAQLNFTQISSLPYGDHVSDIWGYAAPDGTEYALVGLGNGLSIVSLADPENPVQVALIPGQTSTWRDIKTWKDFAYVTTDEGGTTDGLLVVDLTLLPDEAPYYNWNPTMPDNAILNTCHNIFIDEFGVAYLSGCNSNGGGLIFLDVDTEPGTPTIMGVGSNEYSHDVYVRDNLAYSAEINAGQFAVYDVTDKTNVILEATQNTPFLTTHNTWLSDDGLTVYTTDEVGNAPIGSYDVSDLNDVQELDQFEPFATLNQDISPHNVHVWNDYLIISYYRNGCLLVDAQHPDNLIEVGYFDTFVDGGATFDGAWGAYPFLPSGLVLVSDQSNGLFVLEPNYVRACYLEGMITDASNNAPLFDATVAFITDPTFEKSDLAGNYKTGIATAGSYEILVSKPGYEPMTATVDLENDETTILNAALVPLIPYTVNGKVVDEDTGEAIPNAMVNIVNQDFEWSTTTDANGDWSIEILEGTYDFFVGIWGYKTGGGEAQIFTPDVTDLGETALEEGYEDIFSLDLGWEVVAEASQGNFERTIAQGYTVPGLGIAIQPLNDADEDMGNSCFITGSTTELFSSIYVGDGKTAIISPVFDMSEMNEPVVSYHTWFYSIFPPQGNNFPLPGDDVLVGKLTNGIDTVEVSDQFTTNLFGQPSFMNETIPVADFITPTANMKFILDIETNTIGDATEAAFDYFEAYDNDPTGLNDNFLETVEFSVSPNPTSNNFTLNYDLKDLNQTADLVIYDVLGKVVQKESLSQQLGNMNIETQLPAGIYFIQIQSGKEISKGLKLVIE